MQWIITWLLTGARTANHFLICCAQTHSREINQTINQLIFIEVKVNIVVDINLAALQLSKYPLLSLTLR